MNDLATVGAGGGNLEVRRDEIGLRNMPPSMAILLNNDLYERVKAISALMSRAQGMTPAHLIGKGEACFSVVTMALDWKLSWHFVARHTYQTPGGSIGFDGALVQSILEASGRFAGSPAFEYRGNWQALAGKFRMQDSKSGNSKYPVATWTDQDAVGLGVIVRWHVKGENAPRVWPGDNEPFWLVQCQPRNSPLWATDPKSQICYLAIRRFANMAAPGILGSASFDRDEIIEAADLAHDITPPREPRREDFVTTTTVVHDVEPEPQFEVTALDGEVYEFETADHALDALRNVFAAATRYTKGFAMVLENNEALIASLGEAGAALVDEYRPSSPAPSASPRTETPAPVPSPDPAPGRAAEPARAPPVRESPPPPPPTAQPEQRAPAPPPPAADDRFPGDLPSGERLVPRAAPPPTPTPAASATSQDGGAGSREPMAEDGPNSPAGHGPNAPTNASPSEPPAERASRLINVPSRRGQPDYRMWVRGLLMPKIAQQTDSTDLAMLLGDNDEHIQAARSKVDRQDMAELEAAIEAAWARLR